MKLSTELWVRPRTGKANTVKWALEKFVADLDAEMDKMYKVGARDLTINIVIGHSDGLQATLRGEA